MALYGGLGELVRRDEVVVRGEVALDGTNPTPVTTGLKSISAVHLALTFITAPGVGTSVLTYGISDGTLNIYAWKPTSNSNPTLIASTGTEVVSYIVIGVKP
jgi:hypothetical protein